MIQDKESPLRIEPFVNQLGKPLNADKEEVFLSDSNAGGFSQRLSRHATHHDSSIGAPLSQARGTSRNLHMEDVESSCSGEIYTRVKHSPENALPNHIALERAWFTLAREAMAQTDILERFENLQDDYTRLAETHDECPDTIRKLVTTRQDLEHNAKLYTDMANRYKGLKEEHSELEAELARKDSTLVAAEKMSVDGAKERQDLVAQLSWGKGLSEGRTYEEILNALRGASNFVAYSDKKLYPMYDKLFEKEYPFIMKIASGYRHSVSDLLKVHPDPAPLGGVSAPTISDALAGPLDLSFQKETYLILSVVYNIAMFDGLMQR
ncbi:hypothetical protein Tco_1213055 [Tanacetum coccineum]